MEMLLTPETEARVHQALESGGFDSVDALIATAMDVLLDTAPANREAWSRLIDEGLLSEETEKSFSEEEARAHIAALRASWK